jgi:protein gp37
VELIEDRLTAPLSWRKPARIFALSMSDLFHEAVPDEWIDRIFAVMALCPQHEFQVLTKRAERMRDWFAADEARKKGIREARNDIAKTRLWLPEWPLPNVWLGVSVEDQRRRDRINHLFQTPAAVRWLSLEPLLEHVEPYLSWGGKRIDWVVIGGESGPRARPFNIEWARSIIRQCRDAGVACFVKQLGVQPFVGVKPQNWFGPGLSLRDRKGGDPAEWPDDLRVREYPGDAPHDGTRHTCRVA